MIDRADEIDGLRKMSMHELVDAYEAAWGKAPRVKHREYLVKRIAWKREEARTGGLSTKAKERLEELIAELDIDFGSRSVSGVLKLPTKTKSDKLPVGTTLKRPWHGTDVVVRVVEGGFEYDGDVYRSLTAIAKRVTGSHWSGPRFFGLTGRKSG